MGPFLQNFDFAKIRVKMGKNDDFSLENQNSGDPHPLPWVISANPPSQKTRLDLMYPPSKFEVPSSILKWSPEKSYPPPVLLTKLGGGSAR